MKAASVYDSALVLGFVAWEGACRYCDVGLYGNNNLYGNHTYNIFPKHHQSTFLSALLYCFFHGVG